MQRMIIVILVLLAFAAAPAVSAEDVYIVKPGDTLSGIALKIYGDAAKWTELLEANPQVTDPSLIYPGDSLATGQGETYSVSSGTEAEPFTEYQPLPVTSPEETGPADVAIPADLPVEIFKPKQTISQNIYRTAGYITRELPGGSVIGSVATKVSLVEGDEIFVDQPADEGTAFTVLRPMQKVYHPVSGEYMGWAVRVIGWADVTCRGQSTSRARLVSTVDTVNIGDRIVPFDPDDILENNIVDKNPSRFCLKEQDGGYIVASQTSALAYNVGAGDIVFLDMGSSAGIEPGDQLAVYRNMVSEWPVEHGVLQVLRVGEETSTALVVRSVREIAVSDKVQPRVIGGETVSGS